MRRGRHATLYPESKTAPSGIASPTIPKITRPAGGEPVSPTRPLTANAAYTITSARPPKLESQRKSDRYSGSPGSAKTVVCWPRITIAREKIDTAAIAPTGVPFEDETRARADGTLRSRASAKIPRVEATAAPRPTAAMSRSTTSSINRTMKLDPNPPSDLGEASANNGAPAADENVFRSNP